MPKTKSQKIEAVKKGAEDLANSNFAVVADFTGLPVNSLTTLRKSLRAAGLRFGVIKKRLLALMFKANGVEFDPKKFQGQSGVVFSPKDIVETSALIHSFAKQNDLLKILGGFDLKSKTFIEPGDIKRYGGLPSREVLLGQLAMMLTMPIKSFLFVLNEKSKKTS